MGMRFIILRIKKPTPISITVMIQIWETPNRYGEM